MTDSLNALLQQLGSERAVRFGNTMSDETLSTDARGFGPAFSATPIRSFHGICKGLVSNLDVIVATSVDHVSPKDPAQSMLNTLDAATYVARRFGRKNVLVLDTNTATLESTLTDWNRQKRARGISVETNTLAGFMDCLVRGESCSTVLAVLPTLYQPLCDLLIGMSGAAPMTIQANQTDGLEIVAAQTGAEWTPAALIPALITSMVLDGELASARTLERSWLKSLEDGLITEGLETLAPAEKPITFNHFCEAIVDNLDKSPRQLMPSLAPQQTIGANLTLV
ncbi:MAG: hypothetical protein AB8F65_05765 [Woeseiaceae bacterium]